MKKLNIDIETYSENDIKNGVYKYVDSEAFQVLLFAYSVDGQDVKCIDLTKDELPQEIVKALTDRDVTKIAFNAQFERVCLGKHLGEQLDASQWRCTMVHAQQLGLPASLDGCSKYLNLDTLKDSSGKNLIKYFSVPCKPTKINGGRTRNYPEHDAEKWQQFIDYCVQDVKTEMAIAEKLSALPVHENEWRIYAVDQKINDRGVGVDTDLVNASVACIDALGLVQMDELKRLTGLDNPNSRSQLLGWLHGNGALLKDLTKGVIEKEIKNYDGVVKRVLELRLESSKASTKKYTAMQRALCSDGRIHGLLQFYGASRTGRWAGRLVQVQNLARNYIDDLETARETIKGMDIETVEMLYGSVSDTLKQLVRTALIAKDGHEFYVSDFSAIEARVIAWYAKELWRLKVFQTHGKIYEASASQMFHIPLEKVDKELRQKGKVAELALGYQGGPGALKSMGAIEMGVKEDELQPLVDAWRHANRKIVSFWYDVQRAAIEAVHTRSRVKLGLLTFSYRKGLLFIKLPSGRELAYAKATLVEGDFGPQIQYEGQGDKAGFSKLYTYGGKLVENIVQATARDILAEAMIRLEENGYPIVFHVHDEVIAECKEGAHSIEEMNKLMAVQPLWAKGLPLNSEGYITKFYKKD